MQTSHMVSVLTSLMYFFKNSSILELQHHISFRPLRYLYWGSCGSPISLKTLYSYNLFQVFTV